MEISFFDVYLKLLELKDKLAESGEDNIVEEINYLVEKIEKTLKNQTK